MGSSQHSVCSEQRTSQGLKGTWQSLLQFRKAPAETKPVSKDLPLRTEYAGEEFYINKHLLFITYLL